MSKINSTAVKDTLVKDAFQAFEQIADTSSRIAKAQVLVTFDNHVLRQLLVLTYDNSMTFNIKQKPRVKPEGTEVTYDKYEEFLNLTNALYTRTITGNEAKDAVKAFFKTCTEQEMNWYWAVMRKDLKIGIKSASINEVFPDLIPEYSCMLSHPLKKLPKRFVQQAKLDGYRLNAFHYADGRVELKSRNGHIVDGFDGIENAIKQLPKGFMYDGEVMSRDMSFNGTQSIVFKKDGGKDGVLNLFDMVSIEEFNVGKGKIKYEDRLWTLEQNSEIIENNDYMNIVPYTQEMTPDDEEKVYELHSELVEQGYEGSMIKDLDAVYECKKGYAIQKIKPFDTADLPIIDIEEGKAEGKNAGGFGCFVVEYKGERVGVGSGYSDAQRKDFWKRRNELINCMIEVEFRGKTSNKRGSSSLRHGVFKGFRQDKD